MYTPPRQGLLTLLLCGLIMIAIAIVVKVVFQPQPVPSDFIEDLGNARFNVGIEMAKSPKLEDRIVNAPKLTLQMERTVGTWAFVSYNGKQFLERTTQVEEDLYMLEYFDVSDIDVFYAEQTSDCESMPKLVTFAQKGQSGSVLAQQGAGLIIIKTYAPEKPVLSLGPACPVQ